MSIIIYILLFTAIFQLLTVTANIVFRQNLKYSFIEKKTLVSVLIPARNEENNIGLLLENLINQRYDNIEIIVFDDMSTDKTESIVSKKKQNDSRIKLIKSKGLPDKWLGKNHACHQLSEMAKGEYLLFLDADVRVKKDLINKTLAFSQKHQLGLLSIFPKQIMRSYGEKLTVPLMNYILTTLLPLILVSKSPFISHSAANGQFMLFDTNEYRKYLPHKLLKQEKVEDIKISRLFKEKKIRIACIIGTDLISCRMYKNLKEAVNGFAKNIVMFFGNSYLLTLYFWATNTLGLFFVISYSEHKIIVVYSLILVLIRILFSILSQQNILTNLVFFIPQMIIMFIIFVKSLISKFTQKQKWKGRYI